MKNVQHSCKWTYSFASVRHSTGRRDQIKIRGMSTTLVYAFDFAARCMFRGHIHSQNGGARSRAMMVSSKWSFECECNTRRQRHSLLFGSQIKIGRSSFYCFFMFDQILCTLAKLQCNKRLCKHKSIEIWVRTSHQQAHDTLHMHMHII